MNFRGALFAASLTLANLAGASWGAPLFSVDIDQAGSEDTAPGFTSLPVSFNGQLNPSVTAGSTTITLNGNWGARDRGVSDPPDSGAFTENLLLRDTVFPFDPGPGPFTMTISGLTPGQQYKSSVWSYDRAVGSGTFDVSANGILIRDDYGMSTPPTTNDQYRIDFIATATGSGEVVVSLSDYKPVVGPTGFAEYRLNAVQMEAVPEPHVLLLLSIGACVLSFNRRKSKHS